MIKLADFQSLLEVSIGIHLIASFGKSYIESSIDYLFNKIRRRFLQLATYYHSTPKFPELLASGLRDEALKKLAFPYYIPFSVALYSLILLIISSFPIASSIEGSNVGYLMIPLLIPSITFLVKVYFKKKEVYRQLGSKLFEPVSHVKKIVDEELQIIKKLRMKGTISHGDMIGADQVFLAKKKSYLDEAQKLELGLEKKIRVRLRNEIDQSEIKG